MLTKLVVRNFKRFDAVEIELGHPVVFVGPNNSGKTSALQALALWEIGLKRWNEKRAGQKAPEKRPGVAINRRDLIAAPVPNAQLLWRDLHVRDVGIAEGKQKTRNIRIEITVEGVTEDKGWRCGFEFDFANEESFYCRPLRLSGASNAQRPTYACARSCGGPQYGFSSPDVWSGGERNAIGFRSHQCARRRGSNR